MMGSPVCDLVVRLYPQRLQCRIVGEIDEEVVPIVEEALVRWMEGHTGTVVIDGREIDYLCAGALHMLARLREAAVSRGCRFAVIAGPLLRRVLRIVDLDRHLALIDPEATVDDPARPGTPDTPPHPPPYRCPGPTAVGHCR